MEREVIMLAENVRIVIVQHENCGCWKAVYQNMSKGVPHWRQWGQPGYGASRIEALNWLDDIECMSIDHHAKSRFCKHPLFW